MEPRSLPTAPVGFIELDHGSNEMRYLIHLIVAVIPLGSWASDLANVVKIDSGYIAGSGTSIRVYKGIPFAAPPVGELRWQPPQPVKPWTTIRIAKSFSLSCAQLVQGGPPGRFSEDCLTINVWTPARGTRDKLPVFLSIPGGGFDAGSSALPGPDPPGGRTHAPVSRAGSSTNP